MSQIKICSPNLITQTIAKLITDLVDRLTIIGSCYVSNCLVAESTKRVNLRQKQIRNIEILLTLRPLISALNTL